VHLLPIHHPLRLLEELCMLDNLSGGRLDIGIGRGISPYEFARFGEDIDESEATFEESLDILYQGLTRERLDHHGRRYRIDSVPIVLRPVQRPYPPFWYGLRGNEQGCVLPARRGMNVVTLGSDDRVAQTIGYFRAAWKAYATERQQFGSPVTDPFVGVMRTLFIADSDSEAERIARPAYQTWYHNLNWLWREHGDTVKVPLSPDFDVAREAGTLIVGAPDRVRRELVAQAERFGHNYLVLQLAFGSLGHAREMRSLELFRAEVMPALETAVPG
jgi:alkanesulfonate monooxygenase SsuD/methylene tetrahydromethanopterin reductase-like flavin-dependent oxidoreductase (luciferase family)